MLGTLLVVTASIVGAQAPGTVLSDQKISAAEGGFTGDIAGPFGDGFAVSVASLGDLDGDGVRDMAVGAPRDDDGGSDRGAVWILFLNIDGTVRSHQKISGIEGGFTGVLDDGDEFGSALACLGDLDGDGTVDLAVGSWHDSGGGPVFDQRGAVWILFLNTDGTVKDAQQINDITGGFTGVLQRSDFFGYSVASLGDHDGDGIVDLAVGALEDNDGGTNQGAVWILFLNADGTVKAHQKISETEGGFAGILEVNDLFGSAVASIGDLDGDGIGDLAVGARFDRPPAGVGAIWILFLNVDGTVHGQRLINANNNGGVFNMAVGDSLAFLGDVDGDGVGDLASGWAYADGGGADRGVLWILFLGTDGRARGVQKIDDTVGGFTAGLDDDDLFGGSVTFLGDHDADGFGDVAVGALGDDDGGADRGAVWVLFLHGPYQASATVRNDGGINAGCGVNLTLPALGSSWDTEVFHAQHPGATLTVLYGYALPASGATIGAGELLVDVSSLRLFRDIVAASGTSDLHSLAVPADLSLAGLTASTQALILGGGAELCNAIDLQVGF